MLPIITRRAIWPELTRDFFNDDYFYPVVKRNNHLSNTPAVNISENDEQFMIALAVPGINKKDLHLNLKDDLLTVSAECDENTKEEKDGTWTRQEFNFRSFCRSFSLPDTINRDKIQAAHKDGILTITLPKQKESETTLSKDIKIS